MPKPPNPELLQNIEELVVRQVNQNGLESLSMRHIASEANITATTLYYYYDSKEKLVEVARMAAQKNIFDYVSNEVNQKIKLRKKLENFINAFIDWGVKYPNLFSMIFDRQKDNKSFEQFESKFQIYLLAHEIIYQGTEQKEFRCDDAGKAAGLCISCLCGIVNFYMNKIIPGYYDNDIEGLKSEAVQLLINRYLRKKKK